MKAKDLVLCALFCTLIIIGGFLKISVPPFYIMFTMQTFFVILSFYLIGAKRSMISALLYVILGLIGVPIFANGGGIGYILSPTFGFLTGFVISSYICGKMCEKSKKITVLPALFSLVIIYFFGALHFFVIQKLYLSNNVTVGTVLVNCVLVFLPFDLILSLLAVSVAKRVKKANLI